MPNAGWGVETENPIYCWWKCESPQCLWAVFPKQSTFRTVLYIGKHTIANKAISQEEKKKKEIFKCSPIGGQLSYICSMYLKNVPKRMSCSHTNWSRGSLW